MEIRVVNLKEKAGLIRDLHAYKLIARMNNIDFKLLKAKREFIWHRHEETDEVFMVIEGQMQIAMRDRILYLQEGEMTVIPRWVEHKPICNTVCTVMLIEPSGTPNTGNAMGVLTDMNLEWI